MLRLRAHLAVLFRLLPAAWLGPTLLVLVPGALLPDGGLHPCLSRPPPGLPAELPPPPPPAEEPYLPPPGEPRLLLPPGLDRTRIHELMAEVVGLDFELGYRFVVRYGRFFHSLEELEEFRATGEVRGLEPRPVPSLPWPQRPTGRPLPLAAADFEAPAVALGAPELAVVDGWLAWFRPTRRPGYDHRPEYKPEALRVRSGLQAQKMFTTYATHDAGILQVARVPAGERLRFSIWAQVWSSSGDEVRVSHRPGSYCLQVGIDDVWSPAVEAYDQWVRLEVEAPARGPLALLRTRGFSEHPVKHNDSYWDDALLEVLP